MTRSRRSFLRELYGATMVSLAYGLVGCDNSSVLSPPAAAVATEQVDPLIQGAPAPPTIRLSTATPEVIPTAAPGTAVLKLPDWEDLPNTQHFLETRDDLYSQPYDAYKKYDHPQWVGESEYRAALLAAHWVRLSIGDFQLGFWPNAAKGAVSVQFDDFCPRSRSTAIVDNGGDPGAGVNRLLLVVMSKHPEMRMTLFTIPDVWNTPRQQCVSYDLNDPHNQDWVKWVHETLLADGRIEIADHGLHHLSAKVGVKLPDAEYNYDTADEIAASLSRAREIFNSAGLPVSGVRPPGWGLGKNAAFFEAVSSLGGWDYLAASTVDAGLNYGEKRASYVYPQFVDGILNLPQNLTIDITQSLASFIQQVIDINGVLTLKGHYDDRAIQINGITPPNMANLDGALSIVTEKYGGQVWHATQSEIAQFWNAKQGLTFRSETTADSTLLYVRSPSKFPLKGLTISTWPPDLHPAQAFTRGQLIVDVPAGIELGVKFNRMSPA